MEINSNLALALGAAGIYLATRFGALSLLGPRGLERSGAGRVALAHWIPTVAISVVAILRGRSDLAIGIVFATAVAALSLAVGMICLLSPGESTPPTRRVWPFLVPAALLVLLAGFSGSIKFVHALMLGGFGLTVWLVWQAAARESAVNEADELVAAVHDKHAADAAMLPDATGPESATPTIGAEGAVSAAPSDWSPFRIVKVVVSLIIICVAGWLLVDGTLSAEGSSPIFRITLMAAGVISPLITLPLLAAGTDMAQHSRGGHAISACIGISLLNLLALLPALVILWWIKVAWAGGAWPVAAIIFPQGTGGFGKLVMIARRLPSLPMPLMVWRVDTVVLAILGVMLLPAAIGNWRVRRLEAIVLVLIYAGYLSVTAFMAARVGGV